METKEQRAAHHVVPTLETYIRRIDGLYNDSRKNYAELHNQLDTVNRQLAELKACKAEYSTKGYDARKAQLMMQKKKLTDKLGNVKTDFDKSCKNIRKDCEEIFRDKYGISPKKVDDAAMRLIDSGTLTESEYMSFAEKYAGNATMLRLLGAAMAKNENEAVRASGEALIQSSKQQPHVEILDNLCEVAAHGLRGTYTAPDGQEIDVDTAIYQSDGVAEQVYPGTLSRCLAEGANITAE